MMVLMVLMVIGMCLCDVTFIVSSDHLTASHNTNDVHNINDPVLTVFPKNSLCVWEALKLQPDT